MDTFSDIATASPFTAAEKWNRSMVYTRYQILLSWKENDILNFTGEGMVQDHIKWETETIKTKTACCHLRCLAPILYSEHRPRRNYREENNRIQVVWSRTGNFRNSWNRKQGMRGSGQGEVRIGNSLPRENTPTGYWVPKTSPEWADYIYIFRNIHIKYIIISIYKYMHIPNKFIYTIILI